MPKPQRAPAKKTPPPRPKPERMDNLDVAQIGFASEDEFNALLLKLEAEMMEV